MFKIVAVLCVILLFSSVDSFFLQLQALQQMFPGAKLDMTNDGMELRANFSSDVTCSVKMTTEEVSQVMSLVSVQHDPEVLLQAVQPYLTCRRRANGQRVDNKVVTEYVNANRQELDRAMGQMTTEEPPTTTTTPFTTTTTKPPSLKSTAGLNRPTQLINAFLVIIIMLIIY